MLQSLINLDIRENNLNGRIPIGIQSNAKLQKLWLFGNQLTGTIENRVCSILVSKGIRLFGVGGFDARHQCPGDICGCPACPRVSPVPSV